MEVQKVIADRRAIRDYADEPVPEDLIKMLIRAATLAPSAVNQQPWAFAVVQDQLALRRYSVRAKSLLAKSADSETSLSRLREVLVDPDFKFYNAGTLIVICAKPLGRHPDWDCYLAGQNLMLAAVDLGTGTCPIGLAWPLLSEPDVKEELGIPPSYIPVLPIIVGFPREPAAPVERKDPEILCWIRPDGANRR
jgi:nitroreductase